MLPKSGSDHNPLRVNKWWLEEPDFEEVVRKAWDVKCPKTDPI
jgi:hypothetical protein